MTTRRAGVPDVEDGQLFGMLGMCLLGILLLLGFWRLLELVAALLMAILGVMW